METGEARVLNRVYAFVCVLGTVRTLVVLGLRFVRMPSMAEDVATDLSTARSRTPRSRR
jgi:hypothetical protein